jgi:hypothetical protein
MRTQETAQAERPGEGLGYRGGVLRGLIQDPASGLRRIPLPRTPVNKSKRRGRAEALCPGPSHYCWRALLCEL